MEKSSKSTVSTQVFYFEESKGYRKFDVQFLEIVNSGDPNLIGRFLQQNPFHAGALFVYAMFYKSQGNYEQAE